LSERVVAWYAAEMDLDAVSIRLGNVLATRGAAPDVFFSQAVRGLPLNVTDFGMMRYFMTRQEVLGLILVASKYGHRGACLAPQLGSPVSIKAVVDHVLDISKSLSEIVVSGARLGERLNEQLIGLTEVAHDLRPAAPVFEILVPSIAPRALQLSPRLPGESNFREQLRDLVLSGSDAVGATQ
jgi:FlaA1/EpsC-like NDP-sugar epimerase